MVIEEPRPRRFTREQYYDMAEMGWFGNQRVELIEGEIIDMSPQLSRHACSVRKTNRLFTLLVPEGFVVGPQVPLTLAVSSEPEPDLAIYKGKEEDFVDQHPQRAVLIIEIAESSINYDRNKKGSLYAKYGIPELWIVNLLERMLEVYRKPVEEPGHFFGFKYADKKIFGFHEAVTPLFLPYAIINVSDLLP